MYAWLIPLLAAIATLTLAVLVNRSGPQTEVRRVFTFLAIVLVFWNLNFFILYSVKDYELALGLTRVVRLGGLFAPPAILHLFVVIRGQSSRFWRNLLVFDYAFSCGLAVLNAFDLIVVDLRPFTWGYSSVGSGWYHLLTFSIVANFLGAVGLVVYEYRTSQEPRLRLQLKLWLLGCLVALPLALTNILPAYGIRFYPLGNLGCVAWVGIVAYAIVRHRLMDIDVVVTKGAAYLAGGALLITPAFLLMLALQALAFEEVHYDFSVAVFVLFVVVGVLFPTLREKSEARIERSFFREKHKYRSALLAFTKTIIRILDRNELLRKLGETLSETLRPDRVAIFLRDEGHSKFDLRQVAGIRPADEGFDVAHPFVRYLEQRAEPVLRDEIEVIADQKERDRVARVLAGNGWEVCVPLPVSERLIGFLALGRKRNLDAFSVIDLDLLGTLAAQAAIAFENARLYEELHKSRDIIQRADRMSALGTLAAGIAHEIRNPLVSIQTFFQLAPERLHDEEFVTSFLGLAETEVKRIADLVTELLTFARSHDERVQEVDLDDAVDRTIRLLSPQAHQQKVRLERTAAGELPTVRVDQDRIKQVLINIVLNAIQATDAGGVVTVATRRIRRGGRDFCQVEVQDTGAGIPPERQEDIFNPFYTTKNKGTGLGLSIAHQIVTEHGGFITVESREGEGSRFFIHLPVPELSAEPREPAINDLRAQAANS